MQAASNEKIIKNSKESTGPILCRRCGAQVPSGSRFCNMCGVMLQRRLPHVIRQYPPMREAAPATARQVPAKGMPAKTVLEPAGTSHPRQSPSDPNVSTHLKRALEIIQGHQSIPAFSRDIIEIMGMGNDEASLRHLTNTILRDYSITLAVIRVANSAYYNRSGKPICSVARAVTLMGIDAIKRLASGLLLLENYEKRPSGLKELLLLSMLTASHSRQLALRLRMKAAEEVYLCGMFRNLGEVLVAFYFGDLYERVLREIRDNKLTEPEACVKTMGFTYEDLGQTIASAWNLPGAISHAMDSSEPRSISMENEDAKVDAVVALSHELTNYVYRRPAEDTSQAIDHLVEKYGCIAGLSRQEVQKVLDGAVTETKDTFCAAGIPFDDLQLRRQFQLALDGNPDAHDAGMTALAAVTDGASLATMQQPACDEDLLARLVAEVKAAMEPGHELKLNEVLMMALEACHRGAGFDRVVFGLATPDRTCVRGRLGLGPSIDDVIEQLQIPLSGHEEPLSIALLTKRDLFVDEQHDHRYLDSKLVRRLGACCFGLYPVVVDNLVVGCLYFDRLTSASPPLQRILDMVGRLRDLLAEMIGRTRVHS